MLCENNGFTRGNHRVIIPPQGNTKLGRVISPPLSPQWAPLPVSPWLIILAACTCLSHLSPGLTASFRLC